MERPERALPIVEVLMKRLLISLLILAAGGSLWANDFSLPPGKWYIIDSYRG